MAVGCQNASESFKFYVKYLNWMLTLILDLIFWPKKKFK